MNHKIILSLFILIIIGFSVFWKTFNLEIYGDEWEGIWWTTSTLQQTGHFNDRVGYKAYELAAIILNFVSGAFAPNYSSTQVYLFSFLTRLFAVFSLYYFLTKRNISTIGVFLGCLLFLITPVGIQTTDWAKNFTSYISIGFFLFCLNFIYELTSWKKVLIFLATFALSIYVNPIRAHGIIFTVIFLLITHLLFQLKYRKMLSVSLLAVLLIFYMFSQLSVFGEINSLQNFYLQSLATFLNQLSFSKLQDFFVLIGRGIIPDSSLISAVLLLAALLFWKKNLFSKKYLYPVLGITFFPIIIVFFYIPFNKENITSLTGIYFTLFISLVFLVEALHKKLPDAINTIIPLLLNFSFILIPFILGRTDVNDSTHRYLIYSALSLPIIVAFSLKNYEKISFGLNTKNAFFCICLILVVLFFSLSKKEIDGFYSRHNQQIAKTIWGQILPHFKDFDFKQRKAIVYLEGDDGGVLHNSVSFGFGYHIGFIYKVWDFNNLPVAVDSMKDLISLTTDGKAGQKYVQKTVIFPKEDAFYFKIEGTKVKKLPL